MEGSDKMIGSPFIDLKYKNVGAKPVSLYPKHVAAFTPQKGSPLSKVDDADHPLPNFNDDRPYFLNPEKQKAKTEKAFESGPSIPVTVQNPEETDTFKCSEKTVALNKPHLSFKEG